tara:strand:+ start:123 stop:911 length:789 start_codon:yes stop_codon:yes gene_type:complete
MSGDILIIRRISEAFRRQDWFTVAVETLIVVLGVFLGLQVNNWNAARQEHERAEVYAARLTAELEIEYEYINSLIAYARETQEAGNVAYLGLSGQTGIDNETILINAFRASQYNWYERRRATFDEIVASGALALISDLQLREIAVGIYNTPLFSIMQEEGQSAEYRQLFRETIEPAVHEKLRQTCGDIEIDTGGRALTLLTISYQCHAGLGEEDAAKAVLALRAQSRTLPSLRLRNAQIDGRTVDMESTLRTLGMDSRFGAP